MKSLDKFLRYAWDLSARFSKLGVCVPVKLSMFTTGMGVVKLGRALSEAGFRVVWGEISDGSLRLGNGRVYVLVCPRDVAAFGEFRVFRDYVYKALRRRRREFRRKQLVEHLAEHADGERAGAGEPRGDY